jgi:acetylglutamate kinase
MNDLLVAKIGGSTLGSHDTTLADVVELQRNGLRAVLVHGGGALISDWLARHNRPIRFEQGLRVTDAESLKVVVAVLGGLVNEEIVAELSSRGARAIGLSGADSGLLRARTLDPKLGFVGDITGVDVAPLHSLLDQGIIPVIAPIALEWKGERPSAQLLNINADSAAGAIAKTLEARWLVFLTNVPGVRIGEGEIANSLSAEQAGAYIEAGVIEGGMIPKVRACLSAADAGSNCLIVDGREEHALLRIIGGQMIGTTIA